MPQIRRGAMRRSRVLPLAVALLLAVAAVAAQDAPPRPYTPPSDADLQKSVSRASCRRHAAMPQPFPWNPDRLPAVNSACYNDRCSELT